MNGQDPGSLEKLRDIVEPEAVSWWPLAPGWWILIAIASVVVLALAVRAFLRWQANAYRRAALAELENADSDATVLALLKRTAIVAGERTDVGCLSGTAWAEWLVETSGLTVSAIVSERIEKGVYRNGSNSTPELADFARQWITRHSISRPGE